MYNGNYNNGNDPARFGGFQIKPVYIYAGVAVLAVLALYVIMRFLNTSLVMHFALVAGVLLLIANVRELLGQNYGQQSSTALLNCLIGAALVCAWLTQIVNVLLWIPAIALLAIAAPLTFGRAGVYSVYIQTARNAYSGVRRTMGRYN